MRSLCRLCVLWGVCVAVTGVAAPTMSQETSQAAAVAAVDRGTVFRGYIGTTDEPGVLAGHYWYEDADGNVFEEGAFSFDAGDQGIAHGGPCERDQDGDSQALGSKRVNNQPYSDYWTVQYDFDRYKHPDARRTEEDWQDQYLWCSKGGGDAQDGWRLRMIGSGMTYRPPTDQRIDYKWESRKLENESSLTVRLPFKLASGKIGVLVSATINFTTTSEWVDGSFYPPLPDPFMTASVENAANSWWEHGCRRSVLPCLPNQSSANFQGSAVLALWEVQAGTAIDLNLDFYEAAYWEIVCANPISCPRIDPVDDPG